MFWTLVVMTIGGTPISTDLVFDSIDACYEAEEQMVAARSRYATEWMARNSEKTPMPDFVRQNLMRGACIPHPRTGKTNNLLKEALTPDPDRVYQLTERGRRDFNPGVVVPTLQVFIKPELDYRLPKVPMAFRITVRNPTDSAVKVRNPLQNFYLRFQAWNGFPIELPRRIPELLANRADSLLDRPLRGPSNVEFRTAIVNGKEDRQERNIYEINANSTLEITLECETVVGERILATMEDLDPGKAGRYVEALLVMSLMLPESGGATTLELEERIRLPVPKR
jgi:hypothetical protein